MLSHGAMTHRKDYRYTNTERVKTRPTPTEGIPMYARRVAALAALTVLLAGCASREPVSVQPGDGPADPSVLAEIEPDPTEAPAPPPATFSEKYTYPDGVEVEVVKVNRGKVTADDVAAYGEDRMGAAWQQLVVRVRNGSKVRLKDTYTSLTVTYGPDGEVANPTYVPSAPSNSFATGTILPGKAKTTSQTFAIPPKYLDDVVLEASFDFDHGPAVFAGPLS